MITKDFLNDLTFNVFAEPDYLGFSDIKSPVPLISVNEDFIAIIDGVYCEVVSITGDEILDTCDDITLL